MSDEKRDSDSGVVDELVQGPVLDEKGSRPYVRYNSEKGIQVGVHRPLECGEQIKEGVMRLDPVEGSPAMKVTDAMEELREHMRGGPARYNSKKYRDNYDSIFGGRPSIGEA